MKIKYFFLSCALMLFAKPKKVGGQAIIEGVMMRGRRKVSWAVRNQRGGLVVEQFPFVSAAAKSRWWRLPVLRGAASLYESLSLGYKALSRSAEIASEGADAANDPAARQRQKKSNAIASWASFGFALLVSLGLFMYAPMWFLSQFVPCRFRRRFQYAGRRHQDRPVPCVSAPDQHVERHAKGLRIPRRRTQGDIHL